MEIEILDRITDTSLEALKREVYLAHVKSFIDENEVDEFIEQELGLNPDWEWGYNYGCKQAVDAAIDHIAELIRTGRIRLATPAQKETDDGT